MVTLDRETERGGAEGENSTVTIRREPFEPPLGFLARTRNAEEVQELRALFREFEAAGCRVVPLARGSVTAFAVAPPRGEAERQDLLRLLEALGRNYAYARVEPEMDETLIRVIEDLSLESASELFDIPHCDLCGEADPFPTRVSFERQSLAGPAGSALPNSWKVEGAYCRHCVARLADSSERALVGAILGEDRKNFGPVGPVELSVRPARTGNALRFHARPRSDRLAATG